MARKIILSRKGFDSGYGGMPSAFVRGGEMVSFPIPHNNALYSDAALVGYDDICAEGMSLRNRIRMLKGARGDAFVKKLDRCHHDPDLRRGVFGQSGIAQGHLRKHIGEGDLFLFFGWFQQAEWDGGALRFCEPGRDVQALFGFLQIGAGGILPARIAAQKHRRFCTHPHLTPTRLKWDDTDGAKERRRGNNTLYVAAKHLSLPGAEGLPGHGVFRHSPALVLTAEESDSRCVWNLPDIFRNRRITYHTDTKKNPWRRDGLFESRPRGQEFIVYDDDGKVAKWAAELIRKHHLRS